jgi:MoxR-like ATPase
MFLVMATQNPIEQEGTYPLPEAQLDRFLMHVTVDYPDLDAEREILALARREAGNEPETMPDILSLEMIMAARQEVLSIHMAPGVDEYIVQLVMATRTPQNYSKNLASWIEYGCSPRATIGLDRCSRARAWLQGRDFVSPDDVQDVVHDIMRHRLILSFEAEANGISKDQVIDSLLQHVPVV